MKVAEMKDDDIVLSDKQKKAQRARNIAIAVILALMVVTFYAVTILKFGPEILNRPL